MWASQLVDCYAFQTLHVPSVRRDELPPGRVCLRVLAGGLCGSDLAYYRGTLGQWGIGGFGEAVPGFPLHEVVGDVVGSADDRIAIGDRVVGWAADMNGLAEYVVTDAASVHRYASSLSPRDAIILQPLACVIAAIERIGSVAGQHCTVLGQGPIGVLFSHVLKSAGARRVTAVDRVRRGDLEGSYGVDEAYITSTGRWAHNGGDDAPDVVVEAIGHQVSSLSHAIDAIGTGGRILCFGIPDDPVYPVNMEQLLRKQLTLSAGTTVQRRRALAAADSYIAEYPGLVKGYNTHVFMRDEVALAFETASNPAPGLMKVTIQIGSLSAADSVAPMRPR